MVEVIRQDHGGDVYSLARRLRCSEDQIIDFSASINPLGPSPRALKAVQENLNRLDRYPDPQTACLVDRLALYHQIGPEWLLAGNGSTELIYLLPRVLKPRKVLIVSPAFSEYERACRYHGSQINYSPARPQDQFKVNVEAVKRQLQKGTDLVFLCNPNNPGGQLLSSEEVCWLARQAARTATWVVLDEAFIDYQPEQSLLSHSANHRIMNHPNLIVLRSFTKFFALPGLRAGYLVARPALVRKLQKAKEPWSVNALAQIAAAECLLDQSYIKESLELMEAERPLFISDLSSVPGISVFSSWANFVLIHLAKKSYSPSGLYRSLSSQKLLVRNCRSFRGVGERYFRLAVKRGQDNRRLCQTLRDILGEKAL